MCDTLVKRILFLSKEQPEKLAVVFKKEWLTYRNLAWKMESMAYRLKDLGIRKGDRVLFSALSKPEFVAAYLGIQYCGAIAVPIDKNALPENAAFIYDDTDAALLLTDRQMKGYEQGRTIYSLKKIYFTGDDRSESSYSEIAGSDIAEIIYTAGTTGKPKGVILTYKAVYNILKNTVDGIGIRENERLLLPLPLNHSFALRELRAVLYSGATIILQNGFTFAKEIENNLNTYRCTALAMVPASVETVAGQMQERFADVMGRFRYIEVSAGSLSVEQRKRLTSLLPNTVIYNTWGSSESGGALFLNVTEIASDVEKINALGKPLPHIQVDILDDNGNKTGKDSGHPGRMALKGEMLMSGYWNRKELTERTLMDGWLLTEDMVYRDMEGYVYMLCRADDMINVGGEKVSPVEVENIVGGYSHVKECACIGIEDPKKVLGMVPVLFVVARDDQYSQEELQQYLFKRLERYKIPIRFIPIDVIPRNSMGKIDRKALKNYVSEAVNIELMNPIIRNILSRKSIRKFDDRPIPRELLDMIMRAGYHAPSGHNMQTWRFTVVENKDKINRLKGATILTAKENNVYCYGFENPACIILISNDERNRYGCQDASCAAENIFLAANSYGIGSVWLNSLMTLRRKEPVKGILDEFGIPENHVIWCMVALGYPRAEGNQPAKNKNVVYFID